jgi:hypothetical protein
MCSEANKPGRWSQEQRIHLRKSIVLAWALLLHCPAAHAQSGGLSTEVGGYPISLWLISISLFLGGVVSTYLLLVAWWPIRKVFWGEMYDSSRWTGAAIIALIICSFLMSAALLMNYRSDGFQKIAPYWGPVSTAIAVALICLLIRAYLKTGALRTKDVKWGSVFKLLMISMAVGMVVPLTLFVISTASFLKVAPSFNLTAPKETRSGPVTLTEYYEPYFQFHVLMPEPRQSESVPRGQTRWTYHQTEGSFIVEARELPSEDPQRMDQQLEDQCNLTVGGMDGKESYRSHVALEGIYSGREVEGKIPSKNTVFRFRSYIVKNRYYCTLVVGAPTWVNSNDAYKFLNSFNPRA